MPENFTPVYDHTKDHVDEACGLAPGEFTRVATELIHVIPDGETTRSASIQTIHEHFIAADSREQFAILSTLANSLLSYMNSQQVMSSASSLIQAILSKMSDSPKDESPPPSVDTVH